MRSLHCLARALLDKGFVPPIEQLLKSAFPHEGTERARRELLVGSLVAFCIDPAGNFGIGRYRDLHFSDLTDAKTPLGTLAELETAWQAALREVKRTPDEVRKIDRQLGIDVLGDASKWKDLTADAKASKFKTSGGGRWSASDDGLAWQGSASGAPGTALFTEPAPAKGAARVTLRFGEGSKARLRLTARDEKKSAALIAQAGAALITPDDAIAAKTTFPLDANRWYDAVFVIDGGGTGRVYLDGELVAEGQGLAPGPGTWQLECQGRRVEVKAVAVRKLD